MCMYTHYSPILLLASDVVKHLLCLILLLVSDVVKPLSCLILLLVSDVVKPMSCLILLVSDLGVISLDEIRMLLVSSLLTRLSIRRCIIL